MDRAPTPGMPEEPEVTEETLRKKRLLKRLRGFSVKREEPQEREINLNEDQAESAPDELWSREEEAEEETDEAILPRAQNLGRKVLEQTWLVHGFAEELTETVAGLPEESRTAVKPEADRLQTATGNLKDAAEELNAELEQQTEDSVEVARASAEAAELAEESPQEAAEPVESAPEKPKRDYSEAMSMARIVIATLIGGGLGALVGEGRKDKAAAKEKAKMGKTIEQQKAKMAEQEAELRDLKAVKPEAAPAKEYIEKTAELTERQTELTHTTVEQVREAAKLAGESETTFKIPERQGEKTVEREQQGAERLREAATESRDGKGHEQAVREVAEVGIASAMQPTDDQKQQTAQPIYKSVPLKLSSQTWIYWILVGVAVVALGLIIFSPK